MSVFDQLGASELPPVGMMYKSPERDTSVTGRITQKWQPTSGSVYSGLNSRVITFRISSSMLADMSTFYLNFQCKTSKSFVHLEDLFPLHMIESARLNIGGAQVENIQNFAEAVKPLVYHTASADWLAGPASITMGSWLYRPTTGIGLRLNGSNSVGVVQDDTAEQIGYTTTNPATTQAADRSLGFHPADPNAYAGACYRTNSFASGLEYTNLNRANFSSSKWTGRTNAGVRFDGKTFSVPLGLIFGTARLESYLPLMSCGSVDISITLAAPNRCLILTQPLSYTANGNAIVAIDPTAAENATPLDYTLSNLSITGDLLQVSPGTAQQIMASTSGEEGISFVIDTLVSQLFPTQSGGTGSHSFTVSRPFSNLTALYCVARPSAIASSEYALKSSYGLGSRYLNSSSQIGGLSFPSQTVDSTSQAYLELRKALTRTGANIQGGSAISWANYNSQYGSAYGAYSSATRGSSADVTLLTDPARSAQRYRMSNGISAQTPSCFVLGQSYSRILSGNSITVTGINSRLSGYTTQLNINLTPFAASPNNSDPNANSCSSTDSAALDSPLDFVVTQSASVLLKLSGDSVSVSD